MRRAAPLIALAVLLAVALPAGANAQAPPLRVKLSACQSGPAAVERTATFVGSMPAVAGTTRMWMRFDLFERVPPATGFSAVKAPKLGVWQKSAPGRASSGFVFTQRVQGLTAPASFRAQVRFRWYGKGGKLLRSVTRTSAICKQPDQRPDLRAGALDAVRGPLPDQATYALDLSNAGRTAAAGFDVVLTVGGAEQPAQHVAGLAPAATTTVTFVAPRCTPGSTVRFELDAEDAVDESSEADDVVDRACPFT
ncbi:MAG TPA: CARDB domain-containing protein [Solirubrobacteraceae bacterium]|nr:CARDB domain-containing protein [Solirubrobacteraceae bacterium]